MFRKLSGFALRAGAASIVFAALLSTPVFASEPAATGLGQSWPNATDVSLSPQYHVYVFVRDGLRYIQVNDLNGTVRAAVAVDDNVVLVLPIGVDTPYVSVKHSYVQSAGGEDTSATDVVYSDSTTRIAATPTSAGALQISVTTTPVAVPAICPSQGGCLDH